MIGRAPQKLVVLCLAVACATGRAEAQAPGGLPLQQVGSILLQAFGGRITDGWRPWNASYGAINSYHKRGQAIDFVPHGGVHAITRPQIRAVLAASGIQILELLGPGDPGHSNHWHVAFARQVSSGAIVGEMPQLTSKPAPAPANWDVFAMAEWRERHGGSDGE